MLKQLKTQKRKSFSRKCCELVILIENVIFVTLFLLLAIDDGKLYNKYGMPSSHAQFMGFVAIYAIFFSYLRLVVVSTTVFGLFCIRVYMHLL